MKYLKTYDKYFESLKYTSGIAQSDVNETIEHIKKELLPLLRIEEKDIAFIGSAGKHKDNIESFNINIGIDKKSLFENNKIDDKTTPFEFIQDQIGRLNLDNQINDDQNRMVIDWPIKGYNDYGVVEVHIQMSDNLEWLKFSRYAPNLNENESEYLGKHRELLLQSIAEVIEKKVISYFKENTPKEYSILEFDFDEGLTIINRSFEAKHGILKKSIPLENTKRLISSDPEKVCEKLFGEGYKPKNLLIFEQCWDAFMSENFPYPKKRERIKAKFKNKCIGMQLALPEGLL